MTPSMDTYYDPDTERTPEGDLPAEMADSSEGDPDETLLDQLDRRQNTVLEELDELDDRIQTLVQQCQNHRSDSA